MVKNIKIFKIRHEKSSISGALFSANLSLAKKITLRGRALRVIAFGLYPKIRELYPSRRFLNIQNNAPGKFIHVHRGAFLIYSWFRQIISKILNSRSLPGQFWAQIRIPRSFFILKDVSKLTRDEFYIMSKIPSKWHPQHRPRTCN